MYFFSGAAAMTKLNSLNAGQYAVVRKISADDSIRRRLFDMGLIPGTTVECVLISPLGDPSAFLIRGALIALRSEESSRIEAEII